MPNKPKNLTVYFASHHDPDLYYPVTINYFTSLEKTLEFLSFQSQRPNNLKRIPEILYNKYGQIVPLSYQVPRTDLVFYIDPTPIPPAEWEDILITPKAIKSNAIKSPATSSTQPTSESDCWLSDSEAE